ncbi:MAG: sialidase family protein [Verrucomicrobia bacterium]|nr:sialidase family protein [Verrucomicrobiota bacterium]
MIPLQHGEICRRPGDAFGYFGWPSVARKTDGTLVVVASGLRHRHVCPWGKTVLLTGADDGLTWSEPRVINNSPIDDRDAGVVVLDHDSLLVSWFTHDTRPYAARPGFRDSFAPPMQRQLDETLAQWSDVRVDEQLGSWVMTSPDAGSSWGRPVRVPVSAPHGPTRLSDGSLLYLGKAKYETDNLRSGDIAAYASHDHGASWTWVGVVPPGPGTSSSGHHEPHVVALPNGRLIGATRAEFFDADERAIAEAAGNIHFSVHLTISDDRGRTWSPTRSLTYGSPPHLFITRAGALICTYGYRKKPFGQRAKISHDGGESWSEEYVLRDDGLSYDLGYPATTELADGTLFTVYYQQAAAGEPCALLWTKWQAHA